ncbi:MAG TPA: hypothetical protein VGI60_08235 [Chthoniobacterales bacterium]|jgi:hypothetical protein
MTAKNGNLNDADGGRDASAASVRKSDGLDRATTAPSTRERERHTYVVAAATEKGDKVVNAKMVKPSLRCG